MEHHPIPQDITGFQFKLIGEMTVKQFAYLGAGAILAVISFYAPLFFIIKVPLVLLTAGFGAALAFLPIEGRPLDVMLSYYLKALFSPTEYVYQKTGHSLQNTSVTMQQQQFVPQPAPQMPQVQQLVTATPQPTPQQPLNDFLAAIQQQNKQAIASVEPTPPTAQGTMQVMPQQLSEPPLPATPVMIQQTQPATPTYDTGNTYSYATHGVQIISMHGDEKKIASPQSSNDLPEKEEKVEEAIDKAEDNLENEELKLQKELAEAKLAEQQQQSQETTKAAHAKTLTLQDKLQEIAMQKERLEQELLNLKKQLEASQQQVHSVAQSPAEEPQSSQVQVDTKPVSQQVRAVPRQQTKSVGLPQVDDPNIIAGVVKDPRGNLLPNILVEIIDSQNNPVRAFKTNQLGQFLSATQLPNGTYRMSFEDPKAQQRFDVIEITAKGDIMLPLEIVSHDEREALRKELFT